MEDAGGAQERKGPKGEAPGKMVGHDCEHITVKVQKGERLKLLAWTRGKGMTMRALFVNALRELLDAPPDDLTVKMDAIEDQDRISVLIPMALSEELGAFVEARSLNRQTAVYRAIYEYRSKRAP